MLLFLFFSCYVVLLHVLVPNYSCAILADSPPSTAGSFDPLPSDPLPISVDHRQSPAWQRWGDRELINLKLFVNWSLFMHFALCSQRSRHYGPRFCSYHTVEYTVSTLWTPFTTPFSLASMSALDSERPHRAHGVQSAKQSKAPILAETEVAERLQ